MWTKQGTRRSGILGTGFNATLRYFALYSWLGWYIPIDSNAAYQHTNLPTHGQIDPVKGKIQKLNGD